MARMIDTLAMWAQLAADVTVACLTDGPAGAGEASRVRRLARQRRGVRLA